MDDLIAALMDVRDKLHRGLYGNEAQVSSLVVMRLLKELGWADDPNQVRPEFKIENKLGNGIQWVDYALLDEAFGAVVFIEVKNVGKLSTSGEEQLIDYCLKQGGVPLAVLTDGRIWNFYWPAGRGNAEHRRFAVADLNDDEPSRCAGMLSRYLAFDAVRSDQFEKNALHDYKEHQNRIVARREFPAVFRSLVAEADRRVVALFSEEVERRCGICPDAGDVARYLRDQCAQSAVRLPEPGLSPTSEQSELSPAQKAWKTRRAREAVAQEGLVPTERHESASFVFLGQTRTFRTNHDLVFAVFQEFARRDPAFCEKCAPLVRQLRRRREDFGKSSAVPRELPGGWWINVWGNATHQRDRIQKACEVARIKYGQDLTVTFRRTK